MKVILQAILQNILQKIFEKNLKKSEKKACNLLSPMLYYYQLKGTAQTVADLLKVGVKTAKSTIDAIYPLTNI